MNTNLLYEPFKELVLSKASFVASYLMLLIGFTVTGCVSTYEPPRTGQLHCFTTNNTTPCAGTGQDAEYKAGATWPSPRFTNTQVDPDDNVIVDHLTGLMWPQVPPPERKAWHEAAAYIQQLNSSHYKGYNDWRLPNVHELLSLMNWRGFYTTDLHGLFKYQNTYGYVSSTVTQMGTLGGQPFKYYYYLRPRPGNIGSLASVGSKDYLLLFQGLPHESLHHVVPVRSAISDNLVNVPQTGSTLCFSQAGNSVPCAGTGQDGEQQIGIAQPAERFQVVVTRPDLIVDILTGMTWQKQLQGPAKWDEALQIVSAMNASRGERLDGYVWRMPNIVELLTLEQFGASNSNRQWPFEIMTQGAPWDGYWSSTTHPDRQGAFVMQGRQVFGLHKEAQGYLLMTGSCVPLTCTELAGQCGTDLSNGCGGQLSCPCP